MSIVVTVDYKLFESDDYHFYPFCDVSFFGLGENDDISQKWQDIKVNKFKEQYYELKTFRNQIRKTEFDIVRLEKSLRKPKFIFWYSKQERIILKELAGYKKKLELLKKKEQKCLDDCFFSPIETYTEITSFLDSNGFKISERKLKNRPSITGTDVWVKK
jgi:hypothetical protein